MPAGLMAMKELAPAVPVAKSEGIYTGRMTMQQIRIQLGGPGPGPGGGPGILARIVFAILAVIVLVAAAFLGAIVFLAALGLFVVGSLVLAARIWWAKRQIEKAMRRGEAGGANRPGPGGREDVIEGEYRVMGEQRAARDEDQQETR